MKFWDSSAIIPLLIAEQGREQLLSLLERDPAMIAWWGTPVECSSAIARREREANLDVESATDVLDRLNLLAGAWHEVAPTDRVRTAAQRLLRVHSLRSADALQLGAALVASEYEPGSLEFVCLDDRLKVAAQREGFRIVAV